MFLFLALISLISYGQILQMNFWQDDNALVFKFTHLGEDAGYLGRGILGSGPYRYTVTPYYFIYKLFGYNPIPYFLLMFLMFILSAFAVYFLFKHLLGKDKAKYASIIYACGYIASDGFIRVFNSFLTSLSVVLISLCLIQYYLFFKKRKLKNYFLTLLFFILSIQIGYIRTHYLAFVVISYELIFITSRKNFFYSIARILPFIYLFDKWFVSGDPRQNQIKNLIFSILHGQFEKTYSFFSSFGNMLLSDVVYSKFSPFINNTVGHISEKRAAYLLIIASFIISSIFIFKVKGYLKKIFAVLYFILNIILLNLALNTFSYPGLVGGVKERISAFIAVSFLLFNFLYFFIFPKTRKIILFFIIWISLNLAAYAAYIPNYSYPSDNRYLLHSFIPLISLLTLLAFDISKRTKSKIPIFILIIWCLGNLYSSLLYQRDIVQNRALPSKRFFSQLKDYVPNFNKGSIFYFYVPNIPKAQDHFNAGFGVAQMPETTAIAWRYGLDRYDLQIANNFQELIEKIKENQIPLENVYTFIAYPDNLSNTSYETRKILKDGNQKTVEEIITSNTSINNNQIFNQDINLPTENISLLSPTDVEINLIAKPMKTPNDELFPLELVSSESPGDISDPKERDLYINYRSWLENYYKTSEAYSSTNWRDFSEKNVLDQKKETYWEADRIAWDNRNEYLVIKLSKTTEVGGIIYQNGPTSLTPTNFEIYISSDGKEYKKVKDVYITDFSKRDEAQKVIFNPEKGTYIKILFKKTLYEDSPGVSELIILPSNLQSVDPNKAEKFFRNPFSKVETQSQWNDLIKSFFSKSLVKFNWESEEGEKGVYDAYISYESKLQKIEFTIPAGGLRLKNLKLTPITLPGEIKVFSVKYENQKIK